MCLVLQRRVVEALSDLHVRSLAVFCATAVAHDLLMQIVLGISTVYIYPRQSQ